MKVDGFILAPHVRLIALPTCCYCKALAPECKCGFPIWKKEGAR